MALRGVIAGVWTLAALALMAVAAQFALLEWQGIRFRNLSEEDRLLRLAVQEPVMPPSISGGRAVLLACEAAMLGDLYPFQPETERLAIARHCGRAARSALARSPDWPLAHYLEALAYHGARDEAARNAALVRSQAHGGYEAWLSARRFELARKAIYSNGLDGSLDADIAVLLRSDSGRERLVAAYLDDPDLRERVSHIEASLETE